MADSAQNFFYLVMVTCGTEAQAQRVITERMQPSTTDYGFTYKIRVVEVGQMEIQPSIDWSVEK